MDVTARFVTLVQGAEENLRLDVAAALVAAHARPGLDIERLLARLDDLAGGCPAATVDALRQHLFDAEGFSGDRAHYDDPRNSMLDQVLDRRLGIPITLSLVMLEVGRRLGLALWGVGMPGHFLVGVGDGRYIDPFEQGRVLDADGCRAQFRAVLGVEAPWDPSFLQPVGARSIVARILANLRRLFATSDDLVNLSWVLRLRAAIPGVEPEERVELASVLSSLGRYDEAAGVLEGAAATAAMEDAEALRHRAVKLRARLN